MFLAKAKRQQLIIFIVKVIDSNFFFVKILNGIEANNAVNAIPKFINDSIFKI